MTGPGTCRVSPSPPLHLAAKPAMPGCHDAEERGNATRCRPREAACSGCAHRPRPRTGARGPRQKRQLRLGRLLAGAGQAERLRRRLDPVGKSGPEASVDGGRVYSTHRPSSENGPRFLRMGISTSSELQTVIGCLGSGGPLCPRPTHPPLTFLLRERLPETRHQDRAMCDRFEPHGLSGTEGGRRAVDRHVSDTQNGPPPVGRAIASATMRDQAYVYPRSVGVPRCARRCVRMMGSGCHR